MTTGNIDQQQDPLLTFDGFGLEEDENDPSAMSLVDHLEELRRRIFKCLIAIAVLSVVSFVFRYQIMQFLAAPLPNNINPIVKNGPKLVTTGLAEGFTVYLLISLASGVVLSLPVLLYQTWAFIAPGLYEREKKYAVPFIFIGIALFVVGVTVAYIFIRFPINWLISFAADSFTELVSANSYFTFVAFFILVFGLVFELPLVITFMAKIGIVDVDTLKKKRAAAHVGMWIAATFLTPGADLYSPIILGVCMSFLYELTILFIRVAIKPDESIATS